MVYLWENYIEYVEHISEIYLAFLTSYSVHETTELFFVGVGPVYHGILYLLDTRRKPNESKGSTTLANFVNM